MKTKDYIIIFSITFGAAFIVNILITLCYSYFIKGTGLIIDWGTSFIIALILAIVIPFTQKKK